MTGLKRLLGYCARSPFALEHLPPLDAEYLIYHNPKPRSDSPRDLVFIPLAGVDRQNRRAHLGTVHHQTG